MTTYAHHPDSKQLGDVGHGRGFGADLYYLFRAGKAYIPRTADTFADAAVDIHETTGVFESLASNSGERAMRMLVSLREDLHVALRRTANNMHETGVALVDTAQEYAQTDAEALARFRELRSDPRNQAELRGTPEFTSPPRPGETPDSERPDRYGLPGRA